jgi:AbrB family looped-hinge helix DNA binding protein
MIAAEKTVKISSKGQITLPKPIREMLQSEIVRIYADEGKVKIEPVKDVAGSLHAYSKGYVPLKKVKEKAWKGALGEKHLRR